MKSNYKRLGDYIRQVDVRNRDNNVSRLLGVNLDKQFIPSVANTIGTDMTVYKILNYNQFGCKLMSVERDAKMPISLYKDQFPSLISSAYFVFEVIDENILNPDYLFMWVRRPEFDRQLWFSSGGDVRGGTSWSNLCEMPLLLLPIEEQRKIVAEYQAIERRIENNRRLIATLEDTAQTIYRQMFVDNIDPENLPKGWRMGTIGELFLLQRGHDLPSQNRCAGKYPIYASTGVNGFHNEFKVTAPCVVTGRSGSIGVVNYVSENFWPLNTTLFVKECANSSMEFAYFKLKELELEKLVAGFAAVPTLNRNDVHMIPTVIPPTGTVLEFSRIAKEFFSYSKLINKEIDALNNSLSLFLTKISIL